MMKESISPPEIQETEDTTQTNPTDTAAMEAYHFFLEKIGEVNEDTLENFRKNLPACERLIFDGFSTDTRIKIVAFYLMPNFMAQRMATLPSHLPIVHHVRNMLSAIQIFDSYWS